jgi:hypothetical protein
MSTRPDAPDYMSSSSDLVADGESWPLVLARTIWLAVTLVTLLLFVTAVPLRFAQLRTVCAGVACSELQLTPDDVRTLHSLGLALSDYALYNLALEVGFAAVHFIIGVIIFARRSDDPTALFVSLMLITFGAATFSGTMNALAPRPWAWRMAVGIVSPLPDILPAWLARPATLWWLPVAIVSAIGQTCATLFFYVFPSGRFVPRWTVLLASLWIIWQVPPLFFPVTALYIATWPPALTMALWVVFLGSYVFAQVYRYRHVSDATQRQQTKWVVYGVTLAVGGILAAILMSVIFSALGLSNLLYRSIVITVIYASVLALPLSIGVAITRSRLWDIDVLINRTLVYGLLSGILAAVYFGSVLLLQTILRPWLGADRQEILLVLSTLAAAALFSPARRQAQIFIDARFYRSRYNAVQTLASFSARARDEVDLEKLSQELLAVVDHTMQPVHVSLWLRTPVGEEYDA